MRSFTAFDIATALAPGELDRGGGGDFTVLARGGAETLPPQFDARHLVERH
ncbi:hypothetical protein GGR39_002098 [Novosphingobium fluoreni]|uniref:Uncharacterized protein n=1 Tax=Novosphingobium fluoreni TaxID=1391222 RepID=A0A7W6FYP3_9SPHN|nr:hypothetical protein [Novosphingobium fluoreni]MBB3940441.1 hypothetical protein [Novosphingobium fluoreni]